MTTKTTKPTEMLERYIKARYPIIAVISHEESRVMKALKKAAKDFTLASGQKAPRRVYEWALTTGLQGVGGLNVDEELQAMTQAPAAALEWISKFDQGSDEAPTLFVMKDLHHHLNDAMNIRYLRDISVRFETRKHNIIILAPTLDVPGDLEKTTAVIDWPLPDSDEISAILAQAETDVTGTVPVTLNGHREQVVQALRGLTDMEAAAAIKAGIVATRELGDSIVPFIVAEKAQIIKKAGVLEFYDTTVTMNEVGGLDNLKNYAEINRSAFSSQASAAGVDTPKGVLLVGVPGTGKSLSAKAIAGGKMPLLRMDIGALMGGLVGQSEGNMRSALKVAEAVAPAVLWVDEIEKALGGQGGEMDGGTSQRVFGTLLTWMQETAAPVYVVATANDARRLKPELLRRFDDIFWVDLPDYDSRVEILDVHLAKRGISVLDDLGPVVEAVHGYSGAEIEKVVKSAVKTAFFRKAEVTAASLVEAARGVVPISVTMDADIRELRGWAQNRALPAGKPLEAKQQAEMQRQAVEL